MVTEGMPVCTECGRPGRTFYELIVDGVKQWMVVCGVHGPNPWRKEAHNDA